MVAIGDWTMQSFFSTKITGNLDLNNAASQVVREGLQLIQGLKPLFMSGEVAYCCANDQTGGVEIVIVWPAAVPVNWTEAINSVAAQKKHSYTDFATDGQKPTIRCFAPDAARLNNLNVLADSIDTIHDKITTLLGKIAEQVNNKKPSGPTPAFLVSRQHIVALNGEGGDTLQNEVWSIANFFEDVKDFRPSLKLVYLYARGIMFRDPIFVDASEAGGLAWEDKLEAIHLVCEGLASFLKGPIGMVLGTRLLLEGLAVAFSKFPDRAILLIVNDSKLEVKSVNEFGGDDSRPAKRIHFTDNIPAWTRDDGWAYAGLYVYQAGRGFGLTLDVTQKKFVIAMMTPDSSLNQITVAEGDDVKAALSGVQRGLVGNPVVNIVTDIFDQDKDEAKHRWTNGKPRIDVKIAHVRGKTNYGRAMIIA